MCKDCGDYEDRKKADQEAAEFFLNRHKEQRRTLRPTELPRIEAPEPCASCHEVDCICPPLPFPNWITGTIATILNGIKKFRKQGRNA